MEVPPKSQSHAADPPLLLRREHFHRAREHNAEKHYGKVPICLVHAHSRLSAAPFPEGDSPHGQSSTPAQP